MTDYTELKRLAEAFPADLDWDSNTEPFFNGPSGESLGGGPTGFYCVYGPAFEIDDEQYDGPTYVESCKVDFAKFMVAAREGVLALIKDIESHKRMLLAAACDLGAIGEALNSDMDDDGDALLGMVIDLKAQNTRMLEWLKDISRTSGDKGAVMGARQLLKELAE
ncbi:hypothetical protein RGV33_12040 [Pseudomonas sp. Bout1]|uniref:hypothetical protein n=1 Tax=Pseudomonas sp. Bout1 TaxID=3048600 RepID=UPI002AB39665|nr:hypothetical protein [Pseudomonas sp. Bout1]MDY7532397.1 hypothetical protein [Pseudomonas sp. Bout1]MEB0184080.1 hypothetical protein [Pseudomonas sp. Bout1]